MPAVSHDIDRLSVRFDDDNAVADAGLLLTGTLARRLGLERVADETVTVGFRPGRKLSTLVSSLAAGGSCIDDIDALRAGATSAVLGHDTVAATTVGNWLRSITFGHVRQLDKLAETMLTRAWSAGAGPGDELLTIDIDSTIVEVHGKAKQGAAYGYTRQLGLHPLLAVRAGTSEILHVRTRKGSANTARGAVRFVTETIGRVRRAGATGRPVDAIDRTPSHVRLGMNLGCEPVETGSRRGTHSAPYGGVGRRILREAGTGIEPVNSGFAVRCLTTWLPRRGAARERSGHGRAGRKRDPVSRARRRA